MGIIMVLCMYIYIYIFGGLHGCFTSSLMCAVHRKVGVLACQQCLDEQTEKYGQNTCKAFSKENAMVPIIYIYEIFSF